MNDESLKEAGLDSIKIKKSINERLRKNRKNRKIRIEPIEKSSNFFKSLPYYNDISCLDNI